MHTHMSFAYSFGPSFILSPIGNLGCHVLTGVNSHLHGMYVHASIILGCTVRTHRAVNVGRAGVKSAVNTMDISIECRECQEGRGRRFGTVLT